MARKLTLKQRKFVDNYIETGNATQSALEAGYSKRTARAIGQQPRYCAIPKWTISKLALAYWREFFVHKFRSNVMTQMIHSKYGYEPPEWVQADSRLDKWYKDKKRRAKQHDAFNMQLKDDKNQLRIHDTPRAGNDLSC